MFNLFIHIHIHISHASCRHFQTPTMLDEQAMAAVPEGVAPEDEHALLRWGRAGIRCFRFNLAICRQFPSFDISYYHVAVILYSIHQEQGKGKTNIPKKNPNISNHGGLGFFWCQICNFLVSFLDSLTTFCWGPDPLGFNGFAWKIIKFVRFLWLIFFSRLSTET